MNLSLSRNRSVCLWIDSYQKQRNLPNPTCEKMLHVSITIRTKDQTAKDPHHHPWGRPGGGRPSLAFFRRLAEGTPGQRGRARCRPGRPAGKRGGGSACRAPANSSAQRCPARQRSKHRRRRALARRRSALRARRERLGWHYLSHATCLIRPHLFYALCIVSVKDHRNLPNDSPLLKKTCGRQAVLDKRFPLSAVYGGRASGGPLRVAGAVDPPRAAGRRPPGPWEAPRKLTELEIEGNPLKHKEIL